MKKFLLWCATVLFFLPVMAQAMVVVGLNDDVHFDYQGVEANDFHIQGIVHSAGGITPVVKEIIIFGDPATGNWVVSGKSLVQVGPEDWSFTVDFKTDGFIKFCQWIHFGIKFDVEAYNIIAKLIGWWTLNGEPLPGNSTDPAKYLQVPVTGFAVKTSPTSNQQTFTITNDSNVSIVFPALQFAIAQKEIPLKDMYTTGLGRPGEPSPLYPDLKWNPVPQLPPVLKPGESYTYALNSTGTPVPAGQYLLVRGKQLMDGAVTPVEPDWGWFWEQHGEPPATLVPPNALFVVNKVSVPTFLFKDLSTDADGTIAQWLWGFGDGATSTLQNPSHSYPLPGNYTVKLQVTDNSGLTDTFSAVVTYNNIFKPIVVALNDDVHFDYLDLKANDFHVQGVIHSAGGIVPVLSEIIIFGDPGTGNWTITNYTISPIGTSTEDFAFSADFVSDGYIVYCQWIHFGFKFLVQTKNVIAKLHGWWTLDGQPLPIGSSTDPATYKQVPVTGFEVTGSQMIEHRLRITNDTNMTISLTGMELAVSKEEIPLVDMFTKGLGRLGEASPLYPNLKWIKIPNLPSALKPDSFFDVFLEGMGISLPPNGILLMRGQQLMPTATVPPNAPDWGWFWEQHQEPGLNPVPAKDDFIGSFKEAGVWNRNSDTKVWTQWTTDTATLVRVGDFDGDTLEDLLGAWSFGIYIRYSNTGKWEKILDNEKLLWLGAGDMNGDGRDDFIGSFGIGVWMRDSASGTWTQFHADPAKMIDAADFDGDGSDDLLGVWSTGIWIRFATGNWKKILDATNLKYLTVGDMNGNGRVDMLGSWTHGVWFYDFLLGAWKLIFDSAEQIASGDLDGDKTDDLIGIWANVPGIWVRYTAGTWERIIETPAVSFTAGKIR